MKKITPHGAVPNAVANLQEQVSAMKAALESQDFPAYVSYLHPSFVAYQGGEDSLIMMLTAQREQLDAVNMKMLTTGTNQPFRIVKAGAALQSSVVQTGEVVYEEGQRAFSTDLQVAVSNDNGETWKFIGLANIPYNVIHELLPDLSPDVVLTQYSEDYEP